MRYRRFGAAQDEWSLLVNSHYASPEASLAAVAGNRACSAIHRVPLFARSAVVGRRARPLRRCAPRRDQRWCTGHRMTVWGSPTSLSAAAQACRTARSIGSMPWAGTVVRTSSDGLHRGRPTSLACHAPGLRGNSSYGRRLIVQPCPSPHQPSASASLDIPSDLGGHPILPLTRRTPENGFAGGATGGLFVYRRAHSLR